MNIKVKFENEQQIWKLTTECKWYTLKSQLVRAMSNTKSNVHKKVLQEDFVAKAN